MTAAKLSLIKHFIESITLVSTNKLLRKVFVESEENFTRNRKLSFDQITFIVLGLLKKSLNVELSNYFEKAGLPVNAQFTKGAFSQKRHLIKSYWFSFLIEYFGKLFYETVNDFKTWKKFKLIAIDGSSAILVKSKEVDAVFKGGQNKYGTYPLSRYLKMYDVLNDITLKVEMMPMTSSERTVVYSWVDDIPNDSITIFDRGFPSFSLFFLMINQERPKHFIMRCGKDFSNSIKEFVASEESSALVKFYAEENATKQLRTHGFIVPKGTYMELRVDKIKLKTGEIELLITSINNKELLTTLELKELYNKRWKIETNIGKEKNLLQLEVYSSHLKNGIEQDFFATFIANNLHSILLQEAQKKVDRKLKRNKYKYKINISASINAFKNNIMYIYFNKVIRRVLIKILTLFEQFLEPVRPGRQVQRVKVSKRRYGKHQTHKNYRNNM